jgi:RNA polymerase sigma-70 factor (ECF subfamily)
VWKSARRLGVQLADLDDVVQETFLTVHRLLDSYEEQGTEQSWLFSILFRVVQRHRRMQSRRNARTDGGAQLEALLASSADAPDRNAETGETVRLLEEILDTLDPDQRAVLVLADIEEKTVAEVAQILGLNPNTAASRLRMARGHVEAAMTRHRARDGWRLK